MPSLDHAWPREKAKKHEDVWPLHRVYLGDVRGELIEITFDLFPISWLFQRSHAIRAAIAGADRDNLARFPPEGTATIRIHRGGAAVSRVDLPIVPRDRR